LQFTSLTTQHYQFHYTIHGEPDRPWLLLLHGFLGRGADFGQIVAALSPHYRCLCIDLPGHGQTEVHCADERLFQMPATALAIVELLDALQIPKIVLYGYSMGGRLALYLALKFSDGLGPTGGHRLSHLILESASPGLRTLAERQARLQSDRQLAHRLVADFPQFLADWYAQPLWQSLQQHPGFGELADRRLQNRPLELAKSLRNCGLGSQPNLWDELANCPIPVLLLVGAQDRKFLEINQQMLKLLPTASLSVINNAGHNINFENPQQIINHLNRLL
jgi:2-succinyl-6-hydroxy-2,4-cyclohexadiene-1-carboxylate synthase